MKRKLSSAMIIIFIYLGVQLLPIPLLLLFPEENRQIAMSLNLTLIFSLVGSLAMIWVNRKPYWTPASPITEQPSASVGKVIGWGFLGFIVSIFIQYSYTFIQILLFGIPSQSENTEMLLQLTNEYPLLIFSIVLFAPIMEELVFRKAIFTQLHNSLVGLKGAAVISSLLFAIVHFDGHMLLYGSLGLWFCYLYKKTNNIFAPMLAHGLMNAFASLPLFFPEYFL